MWLWWVIKYTNFWLFLIHFKVDLSKMFPEKLSFGLEIRDKVTNFVAEKIRALRV